MDYSITVVKTLPSGQMTEAVRWKYRITPNFEVLDEGEELDMTTGKVTGTFEVENKETVLRSIKEWLLKIKQTPFNAMRPDDVWMADMNFTEKDKKKVQRMLLFEEV